MVQAAWRALRVRVELMRQRRAATLIQVTDHRTSSKPFAHASAPGFRQALQGKRIL